jgi:hypothetical protein
LHVEFEGELNVDILAVVAVLAGVLITACERTAIIGDGRVPVV